MEKKRQKEHSGGAHALSSLCCCVTATWGVCHFKYTWEKKAKPSHRAPFEFLEFSFLSFEQHLPLFFILFLYLSVDMWIITITILFFWSFLKHTSEVGEFHSPTHEHRLLGWAVRTMNCISCQIICEITTVQILQKAQCCKAYLLKWESMDTDSLLVKNSSGHLGELHFFFFLSKFSCSH